MSQEVRPDSRLRAAGFDILPAIDLLSGFCVRLLKGRYDSVTRYDRDPVEAACRFEAAGARWIHLVDLDAVRGVSPGASSSPDAPHRGGGPAHNREVIRRIRRAVSCRLEVGGGIRCEADVEELLAAGADRLVLGTVLVRDPERVAAWCARYGGVFMAGIDAEEGRVKVAGWEQDGAQEDVELARRASALGVAGIVYTSIGRDGTLAGPDLERTNRVAAAADLPVVASGGVGSGADVERVFRERHGSVAGIIVGKAMYEDRVDLAELIRRFQRAAPSGAPPDRPSAAQ